MMAFVFLDTFPSCYSPVGHLSCRRRCFARFPCVHIRQFSFNGEIAILAHVVFIASDLWWEMHRSPTVDVDVSFYCHVGRKLDK